MNTNDDELTISRGLYCGCVVCNGPFGYLSNNTYTRKELEGCDSLYAKRLLERMNAGLPLVEGGNCAIGRIKPNLYLVKD